MDNAISHSLDPITCRPRYLYLVLYHTMVHCRADLSNRPLFQTDPLSPQPLMVTMGPPTPSSYLNGGTITSYFCI